MLTNVMVYLSLGVPLVIAVPQLFFPPQVGKFYLGRLSKGKIFANAHNKKYLFNILYLTRKNQQNAKNICIIVYVFDILTRNIMCYV